MHTSTKPRSWAMAFPETSDGGSLFQKNVSRQTFDEQRAAMTSGNSAEVQAYGVVMVKFLWELAPLFDERALAEHASDESYREPRTITGLDPEQIISEYEDKVAALEQESGYIPALHVWSRMARGECELVVEELAMRESCNPSGDWNHSIKRYLEMADAACGQPQPFCRALRDMVVDEQLQFESMQHCARYIGGEEQEALASFATPEEIEAYEATKAKGGDGGGRVIAANIDSSGASAANYRREMAEYEANSSAIESISQIKGAGAPRRGNTIIVAAEERVWQRVTEPAILLFRNECDEAIEFGEAEGEMRGFSASAMVEPDGWLRGDIRRCAHMRIEAKGSVLDVPTTFFSKIGYVLESDCETVRRMTPAQFDEVYGPDPETP